MVTPKLKGYKCAVNNELHELNKDINMLMVLIKKFIMAFIEKWIDIIGWIRTNKLILLEILQLE